MRNQLRNYAAAGVGLTLFGIALYVIHGKLGQYHYHEIAAQLSRPQGLAAAMAITLLDYFVLTFYDVMALRYIKHPITYSRTALASFLGYAFSHNMTFLGGSAVRYRIYSILGVSAVKVAALMAFCVTTFWLGFFATGAAVFLFSSEGIPASLHLPFKSMRPLGVIFLVPVVVYIVTALIKRRPVRLRRREFTLPEPKLVLAQLIISSIDWLLASAVLFVLLPASPSGDSGCASASELDFFKFVPFFLLAQVIGLLSYVPGGLGVFEIAMILLLSPFYESSVIISSLLVYRLTYYLIPFGAAAMILATVEFLMSRHLVTRLAADFGKAITDIMPNVLALTTFISGVILLFSGTLPAAHGRMNILRDLLPLPVIEFSHFLGSLAGAGLMILSKGIQRKGIWAYYLTAGVLSAGIAFSLLKWIDYEEAIILFVMLLLLLACRTSFYLKGTILTGPLTAGWAILAIGAILCSILLGVFAHQHPILGLREALRVEYRNELWWQFAFDADCPRFLRASAGAIVVLLIYAITKLIKRY